jgi:hypothetical protein
MIHCPELSEENVVRYWQMNHNTMSTACKKISTRLTKLWGRDGKRGVGVCVWRATIGHLGVYIIYIEIIY